MDDAFLVREDSGGATYTSGPTSGIYALLIPQELLVEEGDEQEESMQLSLSPGTFVTIDHKQLAILDPDRHNQRLIGILTAGVILEG